MRYDHKKHYTPLATDVIATPITHQLMSELEHANEQYKFYFCAEAK